MRRFGIVQLVVDRRYNEVFTPNYTGIHPPYNGRDEEAPILMFYNSAADRDAALLEVTEKWPNKTFGPIEVSTAMRRAVGDVVNMTVNDRGILPA